MAKSAIGIHSYNTYTNTLTDLIEWGFIKMIQKSKNQYSSNIIALSNFNKAPTEALDKAIIKHASKQSESTGESIDSINKQVNKETNNKETIEHRKLKFASSLKPFIDKFGKTMLNEFYRYWTEPNRSGTKFRQEMEKAWDLERRLDTWAKKDSTFTKGAQFQQKPDTLKNINIDEIKY